MKNELQEYPELVNGLPLVIFLNNVDPHKSTLLTKDGKITNIFAYEEQFYIA